MNIIPVMNIETSSKLNEADIPEELPILALRNAVLFPNTVIPITIGREKSLRLVKEAYKANKIIGAVTQKDVKVEEPERKDLYDIVIGAHCAVTNEGNAGIFFTLRTAFF